MVRLLLTIAALAAAFAAAATFGLIAGVLLAVSARAHDSWINHGGYKNAAGEWCCGEGDCIALPESSVAIKRDGYHVRVRDYLDTHWWIDEVVPLSEAQPSPDGAYWRCKKPDGSRRCFFAPPPNT